MFVVVVAVRPVTCDGASPAIIATAPLNAELPIGFVASTLY